MKAGAFTRLTPTRDNINCITQSSSRPTTPISGNMLIKPVPIYPASCYTSAQSVQSVRMNEEAIETAEAKAESGESSPHFGSALSFE